MTGAAWVLEMGAQLDVAWAEAREVMMGPK